MDLSSKVPAFLEKAYPSFCRGIFEGLTTAWKADKILLADIIYLRGDRALDIIYLNSIKYIAKAFAT